MGRIRAWCAAASGSVLLFSVEPVRCQEELDKVLSPYFVVEGRDPSVEAFPLQATEVVANVGGVIADVFVTQRYRNEGTRPINARYVFPGSTRAAVHGMRIKIGDQAVVARIQERGTARREFEDAKARGKSASLLEQHRPNVFTMNVANILPEDIVEVELHYTELLVPADGAYEFVYPAVVGPRYSRRAEAVAGEAVEEVETPHLHEGEAPPSTFGVRVTLSTGIPLQEVTSPSHAVDLAWEGGSRAAVTLASPAGTGGDRDFILNYRLAGEEIQSGLLLYEGEKENFFLLMVQPPDRVRPEEIPPREYIFVLDVSGSMRGFPLDTAKSVIRNLIGHLRPEDRFNVILFSGGSRVLAPASLPASEENLRLAVEVIEAQSWGGGTELVPAVETALRLPRDEPFSRTVVVITDGYISAEREAFEVIRKNLNRTNFFCFGIGSSVNRYLVEGIARAGAGEPFVVTRPSEAEAAARRFREYIESPVLTELEVRYDGFEAYDVEPASLPDLFAERPIVLFGKWRGRRAGEIEVSGQGGSRPYARAFRVSETSPLTENSALPYLWARTRIARLSDLNVGGWDPEAVAEVTRLGLEYSLLTRHTSFIAVIEEVRNPDGDSQDVDQPNPLPRGVTDQAVGAVFASAAEPELWVLAALVASLLAWSARGRRRGVSEGA